MSRAKDLSRYVYGVFFVLAGVNHFLHPAFYLRIMPDYLPWHAVLVEISGVAEIVLGGLLVIRRTAAVAAWGLVLLLVAVFPANIFVYQHPELVPAPPLLHLLRLPFQAVLIVWAYWYTRPPTGETA